MPCTVRYATADQYAALNCMDTPLAAGEQATIEAFLDMAACQIHAVRSSQGACDCTLAAGADCYLATLNVMIAAVMNRCPCGNARFDDAEKAAWLQWCQAQLTAIRDGSMELCQGETGKEFPYVAWAEHNLTSWAEAQIIVNRILRYGS